MANWVFASQLLLIALFGWNVHCFPAKGWRPKPLGVGSPSIMAGRPGDNRDLPPGFPDPPTDRNHPAVSWLVNREAGRTSSPGPYSASSSSTPGFSSSLGPVASPFTHGTSMPRPDIAPPLYQSGLLGTYKANMERGNPDRETENQGFAPYSPHAQSSPYSSYPPFAPFPAPSFKGGELSNYEALYEHGNSERETQRDGFMRASPYASAARSRASPSAMRLGSQYLPITPHQYYFVTGQFPPGTLSRFARH